jgi:cyanophycinase
MRGAQKLDAAFAVIAMLITASLASIRAAEPMPTVDAGAKFIEISGSLVIVGGGGLPDAIRARFLELAGGKNARLVIIPTASEKADSSQLLKGYTFWRAQDVASVEFLHTRDRKQADESSFVKPLTKATGVWLTGGDQARLLAAYHGTLVQKELQNLLARGGVIGGTSAGASAMSAIMILGGNPAAQVGDGFGLLPEVVIDQHFQNRNRMNRLLGVLAKYPQCFGLGIDEQTAVIIKGHTLTVVGNANVRLCPPHPGQDLSSYQVLKAGDQVDLASVLRAALAQGQAAPSKQGKEKSGEPTAPTPPALSPSKK